MLPPNIGTYTEKELVSFLQDARAFYYGEKESGIEISDSEFDIAEGILKKKFPSSAYFLTTGAPVNEEKSKVVLPFPMFSLDKIKSTEEKGLTLFKKRIAATHGSNLKFIITDKVDGFSAMLGYPKKSGRDVGSGRESTSFGSGRVLYTRGDGEKGEDISRFLPELNLPLPSKELEGVYIRGELVISHENSKFFEGTAIRNIGKGIFGRKEVTSEVRRVDFIAYDIFTKRVTQEKMLSLLQKWGFLIPNVYELDEDELTIENLNSILSQEKKDFNYDIDGLVITLNKENPLEEGNPSYAIAFKGEGEIAIGEVDYIQWGKDGLPSKDGRLIPVAVLKRPIIINGVSNTSFTGHNAKFVVDNEIGKGSIITVTRSGDVIPQILSVITPSFNESDLPSEKKFGKYGWDGVHLTILEKEKLESWKLKILINFVQKMQMKGISSSTVKTLFESGIDTIEKFLYVPAEKLIGLDGIGKKKGELILKRIGELFSKTFLDYCVTTNKFGSGFGSRRLKILLSAFPEIQHGKIPSQEEIEELPGFSSIIAERAIGGLLSFDEWLSDEDLTFIRELPLLPAGVVRSGGGISLEGKSFVFTGIRDSGLEEVITSLGGEIKSGVSKKITGLIVRDYSFTSASVEKARELNIETLTIEDFKKKYSLSVE